MKLIVGQFLKHSIPALPYGGLFGSHQIMMGVLNLDDCTNTAFGKLPGSLGRRSSR
jgi:hypothetical protein